MERKRERLWQSYCLLIPLPQIFFFYVVVDKCPGEEPCLFFFSIYPEGGVEVEIVQVNGLAHVGLVGDGEEDPASPR